LVTVQLPVKRLPLVQVVGPISSPHSPAMQVGRSPGHSAASSQVVPQLSMRLRFTSQLFERSLSQLRVPAEHGTHTPLMQLCVSAGHAAGEPQVRSD